MPQNPEPALEPKPASDRPWAFKGDNSVHTLDGLPAPRAGGRPRTTPARRSAPNSGSTRSPTRVAMVNAALLLRRPLLVTGKPGTGKSTLAEAIATELGLGKILVWPITTKTTLESALYQYDAIARLNAVSFLRQQLELKRLRQEHDPPPQPRPKSKTSQGPPGTGRNTVARSAWAGSSGSARSEQPCYPPTPRFLPISGRGARPRRTARRHAPRVLLIDEIDKSDIDLPNDLLHIFEQGRYEIFELSRLPDEPRYRWVPVRTADEDGRVAWVERGQVVCDDFPLVIMTSNGEREFPPAFLRRCLQLKLEQPTPEELVKIVRARLGEPADRDDIKNLVSEYCGLRDGSEKDPRKTSWPSTSFSTPFISSSRTLTSPRSKMRCSSRFRARPNHDRVPSQGDGGTEARGDLARDRRCRLARGRARPARQPYRTKGRARPGRKDREARVWRVGNPGRHRRRMSPDAVPDVRRAEGRRLREHPRPRLDQRRRRFGWRGRGRRSGSRTAVYP